MSFIAIKGIKTAADVELDILKCIKTTPQDCGVTPETDSTLIPMIQYYKHFDL